MKLYNNNKFIALGAMALTFASCSDIDEYERFLDVEVAQAKRCVLIEDFTGQACVNCPKASVEIANILEQYGHHNVVAVGLFGGPFSKHPSSGKPLPLYSEEADHLYNRFGADTQPIGMVDRQGLASYTSWTALVNQEIKKDSSLEFELVSNYDAATRTCNILVTVDAILDVEGKLNVWLTEDNVVSPQYMPDGAPTEKNYNHKHVFRKSVSHIDGDAITVGYGMQKQYEYSIQLNEKWVAENMNVVVFVDNNTGVLKAALTTVVAQ